MEQYLSHHGIKDMHWGVRRFQNLDGSLTPAGVARYRKNADRAERYRKKAADARLKSSKYLYEKDKVSARRIQTDLSIGKANSLAVKASRANVKAAKYESKAQRLIKANQDLLKPVSDIPKNSKKLVEQAIDDAVEVLSGNMSKEEYNRKYAGTGFKMTGSEKPKSSQNSKGGSSPDPSKWKKNKDNTYEPTDKLPKQPKGRYVQVENKKTGKPVMVRIEDKAGAALTLGWHYGYNNQEIASILGISVDQLKKELSEYKYPVYNGGIGVGKISSRNNTKKS